MAGHLQGQEKRHLQIFTIPSSKEKTALTSLLRASQGGWLFFLGQKCGILIPRDCSAQSGQQLSGLIEALSPASQSARFYFCAPEKAQFPIGCTALPNLALFIGGKIAEFRQIHFHLEKGLSGSTANFGENSKIDAEEFALGSTFLPDGELAKQRANADAGAVSLSETPNKTVAGRFVFPELRESRDRRCFRFFKDHISADPQDPRTLYGRDSPVEQSE